jgi:hypothetical protein
LKARRSRARVISGPAGRSEPLPYVVEKRFAAIDVTFSVEALMTAGER